MTRILIVLDAWCPPKSVVVPSLDAVGQELKSSGDDVQHLMPDGCWALPMPTHPEISRSPAPPGAVSDGAVIVNIP